MKTRVLLVNFSENELEKISELGIDVDLGFLGDEMYPEGRDGKRIVTSPFYSPLAIYEYKILFIRLTKDLPKKDELLKKAHILSEDERLNFFRYWHQQKGIIVVFAEESNHLSLGPLGIPYTQLSKASGNDKTIILSLDSKDRPLRLAAEELQSIVSIPPDKYIAVPEDESEYNESKRWHIIPLYENLNDDFLGIYLNWGYNFSETDRPAFVILPGYKEYPKVLSKLLKALAEIYPKFLPEIADSNWMTNSQYYPKKIAEIDEHIKQIIKETEDRVSSLQDQKEQEKERYSYLHNLLTESGDKLKDAVLRTLQDVFKMNVEDMDSTRKNDFKEDLLIGEESGSILMEVKGTRNSYPPFTYVTQVFSHLLKNRTKYPNAIGGLIVNHDLLKAPKDRSLAYVNPDEEEQLNEIIYIDTRILFDLAFAVIDFGMTVEDGKEILLKKGRVQFDLELFLKEKSLK